eukprot:TRINITY_DN12590_c0_g1_i23.p2 TRINITY_DN12590_c0_g1~~TRINITY_DN12590_c0_g1_i23.p2  ORF type:complete len:219 (+),score=42.10 TRINITY_DN12590_c0_g1_i23:1752-2408(+)
MRDVLADATALIDCLQDINMAIAELLARLTTTRLTWAKERRTAVRDKASAWSTGIDILFKCHKTSLQEKLSDKFSIVNTTSNRIMSLIEASCAPASARVVMLMELAGHIEQTVDKIRAKPDERLTVMTSASTLWLDRLQKIDNNLSNPPSFSDMFAQCDQLMLLTTIETQSQCQRLQSQLSKAHQEVLHVQIIHRDCMRVILMSPISQRHRTSLIVCR